MAATASDETVNLTDFHKTPGVYVDKSPPAPVILTKRNRRFAAVVSADYLDRAEAALRAIHGNRRVYTEGTFPDDFAARLEASLQTEAELADDRWTISQRDGRKPDRDRIVDQSIESDRSDRGFGSQR